MRQTFITPRQNEFHREMVDFSCSFVASLGFTDIETDRILRPLPNPRVYKAVDVFGVSPSGRTAVVECGSNSVTGERTLWYALSKNLINHLYFWPYRSPGSKYAQSSVMEVACGREPERAVSELTAYDMAQSWIPVRDICLNCYYEWSPDDKENVLWCPKCKSPYWDRERGGK